MAHSDDTQDVLEYVADGFGQPRDVHINGQRLKAVQSIETKHAGEDYAEVTIVLRGTGVVVKPPPDPDKRTGPWTGDRASGP